LIKTQVAACLGKAESSPCGKRSRPPSAAAVRFTRWSLTRPSAALSRAHGRGRRPSPLPVRQAGPGEGESSADPMPSEASRDRTLSEPSRDNVRSPQFQAYEWGQKGEKSQWHWVSQPAVSPISKSAGRSKGGRVRRANGRRVGKPAIRQTGKSAVRGGGPPPSSADDRTRRLRPAEPKVGWPPSDIQRPGENARFFRRAGRPGSTAGGTPAATAKAPPRSTVSHADHRPAPAAPC
jgi:hypothetical protein